jgi:hypothetical protein
MIGYHVYYQRDDKENHTIDYFAQLASIMFWKRHFGEIRLYCNSKFLESIKEYKLDLLYDDINVEDLNNIPYKEALTKYWSFPKIYATYQISKIESKFCILDTDLWTINKFVWDETKDFVAFHYEDYKLKFKNNPYLPEELFIDDSLINLDTIKWEELPMNCAFMYFNNTELISKWYNLCTQIMDLNKKIRTKKKDVYTLFIEQRLISAICKGNKYNYGTLIPNLYKTYHTKKIKSWEPELDHADTSNPAGGIRHIWGLKRHYNDLFFKIKLTNIIFDDLHEHFGLLEPYFDKIYIERLKILQNEISTNQ